MAPERRSERHAADGRRATVRSRSRSRRRRDEREARAEPAPGRGERRRSLSKARERPGHRGEDRSDRGLKPNTSESRVGATSGSTRAA
eukprot:CAMPEP_0115074080 /NCGR_PEP_ID=MMETSP0227-20121206/15149_1 /TAXON_ID=89957 /ORGANISM="Polarella glacialis, Strain CCMP 1383" /LENGTH=87 /DNA_ID=CAMNT_0002461023 /DNA_START=25 /DNA_END=284 /DNA_ORIENTATION=-